MAPVSTTADSIFIMNADGSGNHAITNVGFASAVLDIEPSWSPSGQQIAFEEDVSNSVFNPASRDIFIVNTDGTDEHGFATNAVQPAWSPNGEQIAFESAATGAEGVLVMNVNGGPQTQLTTVGVDPSWSPNGSQVAVSVFNSDDTQAQIAVGGLATGSVTTLTSDQGFNLEPSWSGYTGPNPYNCTSGYDLVATDGGVFNFGTAQFYGSTGSIHLNEPVVGMAVTTGDQGYDLVVSDGGIFNYGNANFYGSMGGKPLNQPIVGMAMTPDGGGYYLVARDGGIFALRDALFQGSMGGNPLNKPIVGMAVDQVTGGYWEIASDGGIFSFGAPYFGSTGGTQLNKPIVGMAPTTNGLGYYSWRLTGASLAMATRRLPVLWGVGHSTGPSLEWPTIRLRAATGKRGPMAASLRFGGAQFCGSTGSLTLNRPIVGIASVSSGKNTALDRRLATPRASPLRLGRRSVPALFPDSNGSQ